MTQREWKPGDVAMTPEGLTLFCYMTSRGGVEWMTADCGNWIAGITAILRPLVVIDPEDREQVERFTHLFLHHYWSDADAQTHTDAGQAALREFANPKPPKPEEPTGLGAVVEDADGELYVRHGSSDLDDSVVWCNSVGVGRSWDRVNAVKVLSAGVEL